MNVIDIYGTDECFYCSKAKQLARENQYRFFYMDVKAPVHREALKRRMPAGLKVKTVPQIFIGERHIGGFAELEAMHVSGELARMGVSAR